MGMKNQSLHQPFSQSFSHVVELSKEHLGLSEAEFTFFYDLAPSAYVLRENFLFFTPQELSKPLMPERFAYVKAYYQLIASFSATKTIKEIIADLNHLPSLGKGPFFLQVKRNARDSLAKTTHLTAMLADALWEKFTNPAVSSRGRIFVFLRINDHYYLLEQLFRKKQHQGIPPKQYPITLPISLKPALARACINMTGSTSVIIDPFVGLGTTLIEAFHLGLYGIGFDNDYQMIQASLENLQGLGITKYLLALKDARTLDFPLPYVFCDLPYGRNTKKVPEDLYQTFFGLLNRYLLYRAVVIVPHYFPLSLLSSYQELMLKAVYSYYVHKNLTRKILVLEKLTKDA